MTYVIPYLPSRMSLPLEEARKIYPSDPKNYFYAEAKRVLETGEYRVWT
jgi:hypothetical protein